VPREATGSDDERMFALRYALPRSLPASDLLLLLALGATWAAAFLLFRVASTDVGPVWAALGRIGIGALVLAVPFGRSTLALARGRVGSFFIVGTTFSAIPFTLLAVASLTLPVATGTLLNGMTPVFTVLVGAVALGQPISARVAVGLASGLGAIVVLVGWSPVELGPGSLLAAGAALGAAFSYAVAGTYARHRLPDVPAPQLATGMLAMGALLLVPIALLDGVPAAPSVGALTAIIVLAVPATAVAWPLFMTILRRSGATAASTVTFVIPGFGIAWGALLAGEAIGPEVVAGGTLVLVSLWLILGLPLRVPGYGDGLAGVVRLVRAAGHRARHRPGSAHA
jgi:drug/metabolite transporter (DMT)-like permease